MSDPRTIQCSRPFTAFSCMHIKSEHQANTNDQHQIIYETGAALQGLKSHTHQLVTHAQLNFQGRPNGNFAIHCYPIQTEVKDVLVDLYAFQGHAIIQVTRVFKSLTSYYITVKINPSVRANLLEKIVQSRLRGIEIKKQAKKKRTDALEIPLEHIPPPLIPRDVPPFILKCLVDRHIYSRIFFLLNLKGHRILFLEPPPVSFFNRRLEWEARLLFPNYYIPNDPQNQLRVSPSDSDSATPPVEGVHYKLLMSHSDKSRTCCFGPCFGANGSDAKCEIELDLIHSLIHTDSPGGAGLPNQSVDVDQYTADELTLSILALIPSINSSIWSRKFFVMFSIPMTLLVIATLIIRIIEFFI